MRSELESKHMNELVMKSVWARVPKPSKATLATLPVLPALTKLEREMSDAHEQLEREEAMELAGALR